MEKGNGHMGDTGVHRDNYPNEFGTVPRVHTR